jgi:hypothetical protein
VFILLRNMHNAEGSRGIYLEGTTVYGRYVVDLEPGRAGFGVVYLTKDSRVNNQRVVVKVLLKDPSRVDPGKTRTAARGRRRISRLKVLLLSIISLFIVFLQAVLHRRSMPRPQALSETRCCA